MSRQRRTWSAIGVIGLIIFTMACALPQAATPTATPTATPPATLSSPAGTATPTPGLSAGGSGGTGSSSSGDGGGGTGGGGGGSSSGGTGGSSSGSSDAPTQLPDINGGPYVVQQIETLGGEVISGSVCSLTKPFGVLSVTPKVTFTFIFTPQNAQSGKVSYAYSIPKAGESHEAGGTYTLAPVDKSGTLQLSLSVSDHVVFKGFDGNIPNRYKFNLVPSGGAPCP